MPSASPTELTSLTSLGLKEIYEERNRIRLRREQLTESTRSLAFDHYPTFISAADCCQEIASDFRHNQGQLDQVVVKLPRLQEACKRFKEQVQRVERHRKRTSLVLTKHPKLLEVLELPQLMDTCVKNGHHEQALAIQQLCAKLQKPLGNIALVKDILVNVHNSSLWMLNQLLSRLKTQIQLPECLRIIGYIRRMGAFNETQLRLKFLQAREAYFLSAQVNIPSTDKYAYLCKIVELTRICVFDTITQYRALFSDEESYFTASGISHITFRQIFSSWLFRKLNIFLDHFKQHLTSDLEDQSLDSLLGQAMYFGQSLGRVGFDFRILLIPMFLEIILNRATGKLRNAVQQLEQICQDPSVALERGEELTSSITEGDPSPLKLNFYTLAELCNQVVQSLNTLRYTLPVVAQPMITEEIQSFVANVQRIIGDTKSRLASRRNTETETKLFAEMEDQFDTRVIPFCNRCLDLAFKDDDNPVYALGGRLPFDKHVHTTKVIEVEVKPEIQEQTENVVQISPPDDELVQQQS